MRRVFHFAFCLPLLWSCTGYEPPERVFAKYWQVEATAGSPQALLPYQSEPHVVHWQALTPQEKQSYDLLWHASDSWKPQGLSLKKITINRINAVLLYQIHGNSASVRRVEMVKEIGHGGWKVDSDVAAPLTAELASKMAEPTLQELKVGDLKPKVEGGL